MRYVIHGACGRMGQVLTKLLREKQPEADLVFADAAGGEGVYRSLDEIPGAADLVFDFSHHAATAAVTEYVSRTGTPLVLATTGQTPEELEMIRRASDTAPVFFSSNFSVGIAVLARIACQAAAALPEAEIEIVETHHDRKVDVPSGTALTLAKALQKKRDGAELVIGRHENGKRTKREIGIHSLRMGNIVGVHEIHIATDTQTLTLRHEAHDRALFAEGAIAAAAYLIGKEPGLYGMEDLLSEEA